MPEIEVEFKYATGQMVTLRASLATGHDVALVVLEQVARRCSAGVQVFYNCRLFGGDGRSSLCEFHELELAERPFAAHPRTEIDRAIDKLANLPAKNWETKP